MKTAVAFVLDESGSMHGTASDTRGAVNQYFETLNTETPDAVVSLMKFSSGTDQADFRVLCQAAYPFDVPKMDEKTYVPNGGTPLYDAIGKAILETEQVKADKYLLIVLSDGQENSSREWNAQKIRALIEKKEAEENWTIVYLGANQEAILSAAQAGFAKGNTMSYAQTSGGISQTMSSLARATSASVTSPAGSTQTIFSDSGQTAADYEDPSKKPESKGGK